MKTYHMTLLELVDNSRTDKHTVHSYLELYETLLNKRKESATNILEVGIYHGGSIKLWHDYFTNATIYGVDLSAIGVHLKYLELDRIKLLGNMDAYSAKCIELLGQTRFDMVLDDGPHTLKSQIDFVTLYLPLVKDDGILIVEDVQSIDWLKNLKMQCRNSLNPV